MLKHELLEYKYDIGEVINTEKASITIIDRFMIEKPNDNKSVNPTSDIIKKYKYRCNKCGYEDIRIESTMLTYGCNACGIVPRKLVVGINDIPTTDPWMIPYFPNGYEEACKYTAKSTKKVFLKCPDCGKISKTKKSIQGLHRLRNLHCDCQDNISYPNKFSYEFLRQLPVTNVIHEWNPDWLKPYFYDNYFEYNGKAYVLEMDGALGHGNRIFNNYHDKDVDGLKKDILKDTLSKEHNVEVIRIDSKSSDLEYIKNNIINSVLNDIFDLSHIDWNKCDEFAIKNIIKVICEDKSNNPKMTTNEIVMKYGIGRMTIYKYLALGNKHGWCNYNPNWSKGYISFQKCSKPIICNGKYVFDSVRTVLEESENVLGVKLNEYQFRKMLKQDNLGNNKFKFEYLDKKSLSDYINNDNYIFVKNRTYGGN